MSDIIEISDLDFNDNSLGGGWEQKSSSFGGGLEFLMNDKVKDSNRTVGDIGLTDLDNLENELNELSDNMPSSSFKPRSDLFNNPSASFDDRQSVRFDEP